MTSNLMVTGRCLCQVLERECGGMFGKRRLRLVKSEKFYDYYNESMILGKSKRSIRILIRDRRNGEVGQKRNRVRDEESRGGETEKEPRRPFGTRRVVINVQNKGDGPYGKGRGREMIL